MKMTNVLLCGVGGQGTLLAGNIIAEAAMRKGLDVKKSEVHGMAQRGGSVVSHVRFGKKVESPLIRKGECDILLSFEQLESLRWSEFLKPGGTILSNSQRILPMSVSAGSSVYPDGIFEHLKKIPAEVAVVDGIGIATGLGNPKCVNVVLLGALAKRLEMIEKDLWKEVIVSRLPPKLHELNLKAFEAGWGAA